MLTNFCDRTLAREQSLSVRQLDEAIQADLFTDATTSPLAVPLDQDPFAGQPLRPRFGSLYIYRVVPSHRPDSERLMLDLGFGCVHHQPLAGLGDPKAGDLVASDRSADGDFTFRRLPRSTQRYTYIAWVHRVVDGDTFIGAVDLGLGHETWVLRFRLASIDTPELSTLAGRTPATSPPPPSSKSSSSSSERTAPTTTVGIWWMSVTCLGSPTPTWSVARVST